MPSKAECPLNKRQPPLSLSPPFQAIPSPVPLTGPPYQTANKKRRRKNEERIINFQRPIGQR